MTSTKPTPIDALFAGNVEPDQPAPTIEREHLTNATVVKYRGSRKIITKNGPSLKQVFSLGVEKDAPWFSLWGSANLNSQLGKLRTAGAIVLLRYAGQATNGDGSPGAHQWEVKPSTAPVKTIALFLERDDERENMRALEQTIQQAGEAERERRNASRGEAPEAPPHTDADVPF